MRIREHNKYINILHFVVSIKVAIINYKNDMLSPIQFVLSIYKNNNSYMCELQ